MAKPKKPNLSITVEPEIVAEVERLTRTVPLLTKHRTHMIAFRLGLEILKKEPGRLLAEIKADAADINP